MNDIMAQAIEMADQAWIDKDFDLYAEIWDEIPNIVADTDEGDVA